MRVLFGTDGIRGKAHEYPLDSPTMFALGEALAHRLKKGSRVLMGMDTRESGPEIARALSAGIRAGGGEATYIGIIPTPGVAYLCRTSDAVAGISISASHNPYGDNDMLIAKYEQFLVGGVTPNALSGKRVVLDVGHGAAYRIAPRVFRGVGADVRVIHD